MHQLLKNKLKEQKGFTLIELLAVIVILGILAAIAIPSIGNVINNTKEKAKVAEALQIIDAARLAYTDDNSKTSWASTSATASDLTNYLSKVKDNVWTVTYNKTNNSYSITGHDAAQVLDSTKDTDDEIAAAVVTEADLAAKAGK